MMHSLRKLILILIVGSFTLTGCDSNEGKQDNSSNDDTYDTKIISSLTELQKTPCTSKEEGILYYIKDKKAYYFCNGNAFEPINPPEIVENTVIWMGQSSTPPNNPKANWAYYNTIDRYTYIYNTSTNNWDIFANNDIDITKGGTIQKDFLTYCSVDKTKPIHILTNIPWKSGTMYRFTIEGYNYGDGKSIFTEVVGFLCYWGNFDTITNGSCIDHNTTITTTQYMSQPTAADPNRYLVIKIVPTNPWWLGFSLSAWFLNGHNGDVGNQVGNGQQIYSIKNLNAKVIQQDADL